MSARMSEYLYTLPWAEACSTDSGWEFTYIPNGHEFDFCRPSRLNARNSSAILNHAGLRFTYNSDHLDARVQEFELWWDEHPMHRARIFKTILERM